MFSPFTRVPTSWSGFKLKTCHDDPFSGTEDLSRSNSREGTPTSWAKWKTDKNSNNELYTDGSGCQKSSPSDGEKLQNVDRTIDPNVSQMLVDPINMTAKPNKLTVDPTWTQWRNRTNSFSSKESTPFNTSRRGSVESCDSLADVSQASSKTLIAQTVWNCVNESKSHMENANLRNGFGECVKNTSSGEGINVFKQSESYFKDSASVFKKPENVFGVPGKGFKSPEFGRQPEVSENVFKEPPAVFKETNKDCLVKRPENGFKRPENGFKRRDNIFQRQVSNDSELSEGNDGIRNGFKRPDSIFQRQFSNGNELSEGKQCCQEWIETTAIHMWEKFEGA